MEFDESFFYRSSYGKRISTCKKCVNERAVAWRKRNVDKAKEAVKKHNREKRRPRARQYSWGPRRDGIKAWLNALKSNPCTDCGKTYHPAVMDLDHVRGVKLFAVSSALGSLSVDDDIILEEVQKCELVCSNCHRLRTWNRKNSTNP